MPDHEPTVIGLVTQGLAEVKDALSQLSRDLHTTLTRLPNDFVPRREVERRFDELTIAVGAEQAARVKAVEDLAEAIEKAEDERRTNRRVLWSIAGGSALSLLGTAAGVVLHFH